MLWSKIKTKLVEKNMTEYELGKVTGLGAQQIHQFKIGKTAILSRFYFIFFLLLFIIVQLEQQNLSIWKVLT